MRRTGPTLLTVLLTALVLFCLAGYQVTSETAATRLLGRLGAAIIEIDRWLPAHQEDIQLLAQDKPQGTIELRDIPVHVELPAAQVVDLDELTLRRVLVDVMGDTLYHDGTSSFRDAEGEPRSLSVDEPVRWTTALLGEGMHGFWKAALVVSALLLAVSLLLNFAAGRLPVASIIAGAVVATAGSVVVWMLAQLGGGMISGTVDKEILLIIRDGAWIGVRNGLAVAVVGAVLAFVLSLYRHETPGVAPAAYVPDADGIEADEPIERPPLPEGIPDWLRTRR